MGDSTTNAQAVESYLKLLLAFRSLPRSSRGRTFMEVSGYPHYENVSSNILGFYFDPAAEHGLKDLLLSAFFQMVDIKDMPPELPPVIGPDLRRGFSTTPLHETSQTYRRTDHPSPPGSPGRRGHR